MRHIQLLLIGVCVLLAVSFSGCASRPDELIKETTDAYNAALEQRAEQYAPSEWKSAKEAWDQAQDQLAKQSWAAATSTLMTAKARLQKAHDVAKDERDAIAKQVRDFQNTINENYGAFKAVMTPARLVGGTRKEYQAACEDIDKRIKIVDDAMAQGDFIGAKAEAEKTLQAIDYNKKKLLGGATAKEN